MSECDAFGLTPAEAAQEVARVVAVVNNWQAHFRQMGVATADIEHLAAFIDGPELLDQRLTFDPDHYTAGSPPRSRSAPDGRAARKSPFAPD